MTDKTAEYSRDPDKPNEFVAAPATVFNSAAADNLVGRMLNNAYRVESVLGAGGMGVVYRATQITLGRPVAVKTILGASSGDDRAVSRFFREARLLSQLNHPNVIHVIDFGTAQPGPVHFMVMEFLAGQPLDLYAAASPRLPAEAVYELMAQLCAGVSAAHSAGIIHRDLKPSNVFLSAVSGSPVPMVKVLDFGLAKATMSDQSPSAATRVGTMLGTPGYSSPEQIHGKPDSDPRSDVYGLGAILYFLASGNPPYSGPTFQSVLAKQLTQPPDPLDPAQVGADRAAAFAPVIHKAMAVNPADRFATPGEFMAALSRACRPGDTPADRNTPSWVSRFAAPTGITLVRPARPGWKPRAAAAVAAVAVLAALAGWLVWRPREAGGPDLGPPNPGATAPGVTGAEVAFGLSGPFSGSSPELGRGVQTGFDLAFQAANDAGGVYGRALRLKVRDDGYDPDRAAANVREMLGEPPVFGFAGLVGTAPCEKALPLALDAKRVFFAPYTGARFLRKNPPDRYVFNYRAGYDEETAVIVKYLLTEKRVKPEQIAVFSQRDGYGDAGFAGVERALKKAGHDPAATLHVRYERNTVDLDAAVKAVLARRDAIKAVVMVATYKPAAQFIRRLKDEKLDALFTNVSFVGGTNFADALREYGPQYPAGVIVTQVVPHPRSNGTAVLRYRELLKKHRPEVEPGFVSLEGYLAGLILVKGLENAGPNLTSETLVDGLEAIRDFDIGIGTPVKYSLSDHTASHSVWGTVLNDKGEFKELDLD